MSLLISSLASFTSNDSGHYEQDVPTPPGNVIVGCRDGTCNEDTKKTACSLVQSEFKVTHKCCSSEFFLSKVLKYWY